MWNNKTSFIDWSYLRQLLDIELKNDKARPEQCPRSVTLSDFG